MYSLPSIPQGLPSATWADLKIIDLIGKMGLKPRSFGTRTVGLALLRLTEKMGASIPLLGGLLVQVCSSRMVSFELTPI